MKAERFQILALDGGGLRGAFQAAALAYVEDDFGTQIADHFDLIVGTSTGGIISLGLGLGLSPTEILEFYLVDGPRIFPEPDGRKRKLRHLFRAKFDNDVLKTALRERFGESTLGNSTKRLVVPSYDIAHDEVRLFKTPHHPDFRRDHRIEAWKVALATSAAPTYLPACYEIDDSRLVDGGVWGNCPVMIGVIEAIRFLDAKPTDIRVLSIGNSWELKDRPEKLDGGGLWRWKKQAVDILMRGQSLAAVNQAKQLLGDNAVVRIDFPAPPNRFPLDRDSSTELRRRAEHQTRHAVRDLKMLMEHKAEEFTPHHRQTDNL